MKLTFLFFIFLFPSITYSQLNVTGNVFERQEFDEKSIKSAGIEILNIEGIVIGTGESNSKGLFSIEIPEKYRYATLKIIVFSPGYINHKSKFEYSSKSKAISLVAQEAKIKPLEANLPNSAAEMLKAKRELYDQNRKIRDLESDIEEQKNIINELSIENAFSENQKKKSEDKIIALERLLKSAKNTRDAYKDELKDTEILLGIYESENDSLIKVIDKIMMAEKAIENIYVSDMKVYAANNKNSIFSGEAKKIKKFEKWTRTIIFVYLEAIDKRLVSDEMKFRLRIKHGESGEFMYFAEGVKRDYVDFYYKKGETKVIFSNYESKNQFINSPTFYVSLRYIVENQEKEIYKKKLNLKN